MNRRQMHCVKRRIQHAKMRATTVIRQEHESSREGPDDSPSAQKAQRSLKSRKALSLAVIENI
jgi:hypothetical protein